MSPCVRPALCTCTRVSSAGCWDVKRHPQGSVWGPPKVPSTFSPHRLLLLLSFISLPGVRYLHILNVTIHILRSVLEKPLLKSVHQWNVGDHSYTWKQKDRREKGDPSLPPTRSFISVSTFCWKSYFSSKVSVMPDVTLQMGFAPASLPGLPSWTHHRPHLLLWANCLRLLHEYEPVLRSGLF